MSKRHFSFTPHHLTLLVLSLFAMTAEAAQKKLNFRDFTLIARESITARQSDIQGPIAAGRNIHLVDFAIRDQKALTDPEQDHLRTSILAVEQVELARAHIAKGGIQSDGPVALQRCRVDGALLSPSTPKVSLSSHGGYRKTARGNTQQQLQALDSELQAFEQSLFELFQKNPQRTRRQIQRQVEDITLMEFERLPQALLLNGNFRAESRVIVRVNQTGSVDIKGVTLYLEGGINPSQIVFWFPNASQILLTQSGSRSPHGDLGFTGTLLALRADLTAYSALLTGAAYIKGFNGISDTATSMQINAASLQNMEGAPAQGEQPPVSL
jgi:choice-of-anchor A domain-containing protein